MLAKHSFILRVKELNNGLGDPQYGPNVRSKETRVCYVPGCGRRTSSSRYTCPVHKPQLSGLPQSFPGVIQDFETRLHARFNPGVFYS